MQTVLQLFKVVILEETFMGQLIHKVEAVQFQAFKKVQNMVKIFIVKHRKSA